MVETCTVTLVGRGTECPYALYFINPNLSDKVLYYQPMTIWDGNFNAFIRTGCEDATNYPEVVVDVFDDLGDIGVNRNDGVRFPVMKNSIIYIYNIYSAAIDYYNPNDAELIYHNTNTGTGGQDDSGTMFVIKNDTVIEISMD